MNIKQIIENHYSTKAFDPAKKIAVEDFELIKAALQGPVKHQYSAVAFCDCR